MITVSEQYINEQNQVTKGRTKILIQYGIASDVQPKTVDLDTGVNIISTNYRNSIIKNTEIEHSYIACAKNYWKLDGKQIILPNDYTKKIVNCGLIGLTSSNELKEFKYTFKETIESPYVDFIFDTTIGLENIENFVIKFDTQKEIYPTEFDIEFYANDTLKESKQIIDNDSPIYVFEGIVNQISKVRIVVHKINVANCLLLISDFMIGNYIEYTENDLEGNAFNYEKHVSLLSNELSYAKLVFNINNLDHKYNPFNPQGIYKNFNQRQPIVFKIGQEFFGTDKVEWLTVANLITDEITFSENKFSIHCIDLLSSLEENNNYTKYLNAITKETWAQVIDELKYNSGNEQFKSIILNSKLENELCTTVFEPIPIKECLQLIANVNNNVVQTNRFGTIEYKDAWLPSVTISANNQYPNIDINAIYNTNELPLENVIQSTNDFWDTRNEKYINSTTEKIPQYISEYICDENGIFETPIVLNVDYSLPITVESLYIIFDHLQQEYAKDFTVKYYPYDSLTKRYTDPIEYVFNDHDTFGIQEDINLDNIVRMELTITKWSVGRRRCIINQIGYGRIEDFYLDYFKIKSHPTFELFKQIKNIDNKYYHYVSSTETNDIVASIKLYGNGRHTITTEKSYGYLFVEKISGTGEIKNMYNAYSSRVVLDIENSTDYIEVILKGNELSTETLVDVSTLNATGDVVELDNPLCTTNVLANKLSMWYYDYIKKGGKFKINYRGDARIEPFDFIYIQTQYMDKIPVVVTKVTLDYNSGLSGTLECMNI